MNCDYFSKCGSCTLYDKTYDEQLKYKIDKEKERFKSFVSVNFDVIKSSTENFRNRAEFRFWRNYDSNDLATLSYAMNTFDKKALEIDTCSIVSLNIKNLMPKLLNKITNIDILKHKIYSCEFLNSSQEDILVTLIYHTKLGETWIKEASELEKSLGIKIIGRSRKQKVILSQDFIKEELLINNHLYKFEYQEGGFTQPNTKVNIEMIKWVLSNTKIADKNKEDLCELYCGGGNFTIPLSFLFNRVLATEISKTSIKSAKRNCELNNISNISFVRMSSEEFVEAIQNKRQFVRLKDIDLQSYDFSTIFVDPPRSGLDDTTRQLVKDFNQIIYISCNPETLYRDLNELSFTHQLLNFAFFDQFAYTNHIECGAILIKK